MGASSSRVIASVRVRMAGFDTRAVTVAGATLAFLGCCLFVLHAEGGFESLKLAEDEVVAEAPALPKAALKAVISAGRKAKAPGLYKDPVIGPKFKKDLNDKASKKWPAPVGTLQKNCIALKAYSYTIQDAAIDAGMSEMGVVYNLVRAMAPTPNPEKKNMSPAECEAQFEKFVAKTKADFKTPGSLPLKELGAIENSMKKTKSGLLVTVHVDNKKLVVLNGQKLGLSEVRAMVHIPELATERSNIADMLQSMQGTYDSVMQSIEAEPDKTRTLDLKDEEDLIKWKGK